MTDATATAQPAARRTAAGEGDAYWFFDSLMVVRSGQPGRARRLTTAARAAAGRAVFGSIRFIHDWMDSGRHS